MQDTRFSHLHATGIAGVIVILTAEVERAVNHKMRQVVCGAAALRGGLGADDTKCQDDFGRGMLVGQDVGGLAFATVATVQTADDAIGRQDDRARHASGIGRPPDYRSGVGYSPVPSRIRHDDIDGWAIEVGRPATWRFHRWLFAR